MPSQMSLFGLQYCIGDEDHPLTIWPTYGGIDRRESLVPSPSVPVIVVMRGICRFCGCHGNSCLDRTGDRCDWTDPTRTCCTSEPCRARLAAAAAAPSSSKPVAAQKPAKPAIKKRRYAGSRVDRAWNRYLSS